MAPKYDSAAAASNVPLKCASKNSIPMRSQEYYEEVLKRKQKAKRKVKKLYRKKGSYRDTLT